MLHSKFSLLPLQPSLPTCHALVTTSTSQQRALLLPPTTSQLKKIKVSDKALPSGIIQESLDDINDIIARYPGLKGAKLPTLAQKLTKEAVFGEKIMKQCTPLGSRCLPGLQLLSWTAWMMCSLECLPHIVYGAMHLQYFTPTCYTNGHGHMHVCTWWPLLNRDYACIIWLCYAYSCTTLIFRHAWLDYNSSSTIISGYLNSSV